VAFLLPRLLKPHPPLFLLLRQRQFQWLHQLQFQWLLRCLRLYLRLCLSLLRSI
jgi:hypothetical protein